MARRTGYIPPTDGVRSDLASLSAKLPQVGSTMRNKHGVEWTVYDHTRASSIATKAGDESEQTCYPVIFPENLSERFHALLDEVSRCTPKVILPLDTMPDVFPGRAHSGGHSIDAWSHPEAIHVFIDAEDCSEVVFAHELAHAWIDFVKGIEDHRVWKDREDAGRYTQVQLMQSYVLDFAVHKLLEDKGFDQAQIRADWEVASMQLRVAAEHGFRPENPREAIYMASHLAAVLVEESISTLPIPLANSLPMVKRNLPEIFSTANGLAQAVSDSYPNDRESAIKAIDSVLKESFAFTDPGLDYESQLLYVAPEVNWEQDKRPDWLTGQPVRAKCEIGVAMAKLGASSADTPVLHRKNDQLEVRFSKADGSQTEPMHLEHAVIPPGPGEEVKRANEVIEEMRQAKKRLEEMRKFTEPKHPSNIPLGPFGPQQQLPPGSPFDTPGPNIPGFRPRSYSPGLARWLTKVRMEEALAGEHPYAYANGNPTTITDPSGLNPDRVGPCAVYVCRQYGWGPPPKPPTHKYLCVTGPNGGCAGGLYPAHGKGNPYEWGVPGRVGDEEKDCKYKKENPSTGQFRVECEDVTNRVPKEFECEIAAAFCECIRLLRKKPPGYEGLNTCYAFPSNVADCVIDRTSGTVRGLVINILDFRL